MSNPMRYIKDLEAAGFMRNQAEAQVQMVLDVIDGGLMTKSDFAFFQERSDNRYFQLQKDIENRFLISQQQIQNQFKESELRLMTRLGFLTVSTVSIAVALLTWLIKI